MNHGRGRNEHGLQGHAEGRLFGRIVAGVAPAALEETRLGDIRRLGKPIRRQVGLRPHAAPLPSVPGYKTAGLRPPAALRRAPASLLAPFSFTQLIWVTILGFLVFGDFPDNYTLLGAAIVVGSSGYVFYRENVVKRATKGVRP